MGGHLLCLELMTDVAGAAHAHGLQAEDVDFGEVAACQSLKPGPVPSSLCSARFHQNPPFISLCDSDCNILDIAYKNYSSDNRQ